MVAIASTILSLLRELLAAYAIQRLRFKGSATMWASRIYLAYLVPPSILFIPLATWSSSSACSTARWR